jgi:hypothetical protein
MLNDRKNEDEKLWKISDRRVDRLYSEYTKLGFFVMVNQRNHVGPDLIVIATPEGKIIKVIEATNYKTREEYIANDKMVRYIKTLDSFDCIQGIKKEIVVSFKENIHAYHYKQLAKSNISIVIVGNQD